ncbi:hypothetical protein [Methylotenera sp.]|uniref:hypothetical protein n=1 Tax=Methylotenera sp. TaxID=2051956 RepID=UPI0024888D0D|nr:hypothetical protein [Methylotenera sp.]MDI1362567.1 hypothetical protein [Methylotenera sp.]
MQLNRVVNSMLKENTGGYITDSGGAYGRNWERNQKRNFTKEEACSATFSVFEQEGEEPKLEVDTELNLYHWLDRNFSFDKNTDARFQRWAAKHPDEYWLELMDSFAEHDHDLCYGGEGPQTYNSYNEQTDLSQTIQYVKYTNRAGEEVWLISVHGGCDVRGGYAKPRAFNPKNEWPEMRVRTLYAGDQSWDYNYSWHGQYEAVEEDQAVQDLWALPCILQECDEFSETGEDIRIPDLTLIKEPCVLVVYNKWKHDGKGYLVSWQKDFDLGGQLALDGEPAYKISLIAEEIFADTW